MIAADETGRPVHPRHAPLVCCIERGLTDPKSSTLAAIQRALEEAGIEFTNGPGVKMRGQGR